MSTGLTIKPLLDQSSLREATFGIGPWSDKLRKAIASVRLEQDTDGVVKASLSNTADDSVANATAHALAHRIEMGRDGAKHVGISMTDAYAWAKIGTTLLYENSRTGNIDRDATERGAQALLTECFSDSFISNH